jgi:bifunctional non-homologous end joining protein LigD
MQRPVMEPQPKRFVAQMAKAKRDGRIFIDWLRNERGATAVAPFSVRARPGAPVALPVDWDQLATLKAANSFSLDEARAEFRRQRSARADDCGKAAESVRQVGADLRDV